MASKRAISYTKASVWKAIEEFLEDGEAAINQHASEPDGISYQYLQIQQYGALNLATKLGFDCACDPDASDTVPRCRCKPKRGGIKRGHQILSGRPGLGLTFDGKNCRDSQGKFVPIPRCTGRKRTRQKKRA